LASGASVSDLGTTLFTANFSTTTPFTRTLSNLSVGGIGSVSLGASLSPLAPEILNVTVALTMTGIGRLDLANNEMIVKSPPGTIEGLLASGVLYSSYTGVGTTLGYKAIGPGVTEVRYTLLGDTNLDATVDVTDLGNLATSYGSSSATWQQGDFDRNNTVDVTDLGDLATNYGRSLAAGSDTSALPAALTAAVPEPASMSTVGLAVIGALVRRRRPRRRSNQCRSIIAA
jgi:hypothetical protein